MGKTFVHIRNPYNLPARQRKAGVHRLQDDDGDDVGASRPSYVPLTCKACKQKQSVPDWKIDAGDAVICSHCKATIDV